MTLLEATIKKNREKAKNEGRIEGEKKGKLEIAIGLYEDGVDHEIITRRTGYSVKEIKDAISKKNKPTKEAA